MYAPYLEWELCRFLASLPPRVTATHTLHAETIARAYPEFAAIPYAVPGFESGIPFFRRIAGKAIGYVLTNNCPVISKLKTLARLGRAAVSARYAKEALSLAPQLVYLTQLFAEVH